MPSRPPKNHIGYTTLLSVSAICFLISLVMFGVGEWRDHVARRYFEIIEARQPKTLDELAVAMQPILRNKLGDKPYVRSSDNAFARFPLVRLSWMHITAELEQDGSTIKNMQLIYAASELVTPPPEGAHYQRQFRFPPDILALMFGPCVVAAAFACIGLRHRGRRFAQLIFWVTILITAWQIITAGLISLWLVGQVLLAS